MSNERKIIMKKFIIGAVVALLLSLVPAPAQANGPHTAITGPDVMSGLNGQASVYMRVDYYAFSGGERVDHIRIQVKDMTWVANNPAITINSLTIRNGSGTVVWSRHGHSINKVGGVVDRHWYPDQFASYNMSVYANYTVHWSNGNSSTGSMSQHQTP